MTAIALGGRASAAVATVVAGVMGLLMAWWTPRGPITTVEALVTIAVGLIVGAAAGVLMRSRWAMLLAPVMFVITFELARWSVTGPLVDGITPTSTYGVLAFVLGRGLNALLVLFPMVLGATLGAAWARRRRAADRHAGVGQWIRRAVTAVAAVALVALVAGIARPAVTDPILGADGEPLAGSVAELTRVEIGDHDLAMMIRGDDTDAPILLYLAGGPGGTDIGALRRNGERLEQAFVVATYDQRGSGKSYDALDPRATLTLDQAVSNTIDVTEYLLDRFDQDKVFLVGNSWGSLLGVLAVAQRPELFHAYVGAGQMVDLEATDRIYYDDTRAWADRTDNIGLAQQLQENGPPPYADPLDYEPTLSYEHEVYPYDDSGLAEGAAGFSENLFYEEYTLLEQLHNLAAFLDVFTALYPQLQAIDLRAQVRELDVPVYLVQGQYETRGRAEPAAEWFELLRAPHKQLIVFENSGHRSLFQEPDRFFDVMTGIVLAEAAEG